MSLAKEDLDDLKYAKSLLENPSLAARISNLLGTPIEKGFEHLPAKWKDIVRSVTEKSLKKALSFAVKTMDDKTRPASSDKTHKILVFATGAGGWRRISWTSSFSSRASCDHSYYAPIHSRHRAK